MERKTIRFAVDNAGLTVHGIFWEANGQRVDVSNKDWKVVLDDGVWRIARYYLGAGKCDLLAETVSDCFVQLELFR
jgi:hypothetical protein